MVFGSLFGSGTTIGLDIGSSVVKAVQLKKTGKGIDLEKLGVAEVFPGGDKSIGKENIRALKSGAIKKALESAGITAKFVISSVSGESIIVRYIQLPDMPEEELKNALKWEAEEYIPFPIDEVNIDSVILGKTGEGTGTKVNILLVATKKEIINEHIDIIRSVGLTPIIVDVDSFAFLNCFEINYKPSLNDVVALINIGSEITSINIYVGGASKFSRDINIAGDSVTNAIQGKLGVDFLKAEAIKFREGAPFKQAVTEESQNDASFIDTIRGTVAKITGEDLGDDSSDVLSQKVIKNTLGNLLNEIKRSIQFFENQSNGQNVQKVIIGGGTSKTKNIDKYFEKELGLPTEIIDPLKRINVTDKSIDMNLLNNSRELLPVCIGLALRKVVE